MGEDKTVVVKRSGASLVDQKPLFSYDSKCLFCCAGQVVKVFSTASGQCTQELVGHTGLVTGVQINPKNKLQLLSCSLDQTVIKWDYSDGVLLQKYQVHCPLYGILSERLTDNSVILIQEPSSKNFQVVRYYLSADQKDEGIQSKPLFKTEYHNASRVAIGCKGEFVVTVHERKLQIYSFKKKRYQSHVLDNRCKYHFTCVTCHPTEYCIAVGTSDGQIIYWWNFMSKEKVVKSVNHWHSLSVLDLNFTAEGSYLLSGGYECVLVKWQYNSHYKDFLPRLGSPLNHVACSPDNLLYATSHMDNAIRIISNSFNLQQVYQGMTKCPQYKQSEVPVPTGLLCDPRTKALVLNGQPGHLQFYSVHTDRQLYNLDIVHQNYISPENLHRPLEVTKITNAAFSDSGNWFCTVQHWDDGVMSPEIRLKFWSYVAESQTYILNTVVEMPHDKAVKCLKFRPDTTIGSSQPVVISTSLDGKFKLWRLIDDTDIYRNNMKWSCDMVGYYHNKSAGPASFAEDGSLLAVAFESTITIWEPENNILRETLHSNLDDTSIRSLEFGRFSCCHLLISASLSSLKCWNLLSCTVQWVVDVESSILVSDPKSDIMAVVSVDQSLYVFKPSNQEYIFKHSDVSKSDVIGGVFVPQTQEISNEGEISWQAASQLYLINQDQELFTLCKENNVREENVEEKILVKENLPLTPFSVLMTSNTRKSGVTDMEVQEQDRATNLPTAGYIKQLLSVAPHAQPPVTSLCASFVESLLISRKKSRSKDKSDSDEDDEDSDMENITSKLSDDSDSSSDMEVDGIVVKGGFNKNRTIDSNLSEQIQQTVKNKNISSDKKSVNVVCNKIKYDWYSPTK